MKHRLGLVGWLMAVIAATLVHSPLWLGLVLATVLAVSGHGRAALLSRALRAVAPILLLISLGYLAMGALTGELNWGYLALLNLRVGLLALLTAWMLRDVQLERALAGYPTALRWLSIVRSQVNVFRRLAAEHRDAVRSRSTVPPTLAQRYRAGATLGLAALDKAVHNAEAVTQGMRSRGALDG
jgi:cobalt/nickel transport system permease protein